MIQWVYERASAVLPRLLVATDDPRIRKTVEGFGGEAVMTSPGHRTGTERCAEALELYQREQEDRITHVINIQGDEPLLKAEHLEALMSCFRDPDTRIATLVQVLHQYEELANPNVVKVVVDPSFRALYFSRSPIPFVRERSQAVPGPRFYAHIGLYGFREEVLRQVVNLPPTPLEEAESLEQLRWLEHGIPVQIRVTDHPSMGVDTPEDLAKISKLI
jgi:3-deoxy-manno-octulosonate cytidylyltransferase (CMP-KDO synthetase)